MAENLQPIVHGALGGLLRLPDEAGAQPAPLLCFLHGHEEAAPQPATAALSRHGPLHPAAAAAGADAFIVVAPQLPVAGDHWHRHADDVCDLVARICAAHGGNPDRCHLTGFSFGGNGVFDLPLLRPGVWAALWAVDPTRLPESALREPVWLSIGEVARRRDYDFVDRLQSKPPDAALLGRRIHLDEGDDHVGSGRRAYADPRIYAWLLRQSRLPPAR